MRLRETPETDAAACDVGMGHHMVDADFARKLERERDAALEDAKRATYDAAQETIKVGTVKSHWIEACRERDEAREQIKGWELKWKCAVEMAALARLKLDNVKEAAK